MWRTTDLGIEDVLAHGAAECDGAAMEIELMNVGNGFRGPAYFCLFLPRTARPLSLRSPCLTHRRHQCHCRARSSGTYGIIACHERALFRSIRKPFTPNSSAFTKAQAPLHPLLQINGRRLSAPSTVNAVPCCLHARIRPIESVAVGKQRLVARRRFTTSFPLSIRHHLPWYIEDSLTSHDLTTY